MENITDFRNNIAKDLNKIPNWINSTDHLHYILWQALSECNAILHKLIRERVLGDRQIKSIINDFDDYIQAIINNTEPHIHLKISAYYLNLIEHLITLILEGEHFENCYNLKRFRDIYYNQTI
jgi:hypothetical protein